MSAVKRSAGGSEQLAAWPTSHVTLALLLFSVNTVILLFYLNAGGATRLCVLIKLGRFIRAGVVSNSSENCPVEKRR